jgi:hypothetical protein
MYLQAHSLAGIFGGTINIEVRPDSDSSADVKPMCESVARLEQRSGALISMLRHHVESMGVADCRATNQRISSAGRS